jgi:hypothetical protein
MYFKIPKYKVETYKDYNSTYSNLINNYSGDVPVRTKNQLQKKNTDYVDKHQLQKNITDYDYNNSEIQYHDDVNTISENTQAYGLPGGTLWLKDKNGNIYPSLLSEDDRTNFTYYKPGTYNSYGSQYYVPSYEDSVLLSKYNTKMRKSLYSS